MPKGEGEAPEPAELKNPSPAKTKKPTKKQAGFRTERF
jgi:hypothetical protein